jgi:hypothetical protein
MDAGQVFVLILTAISVGFLVYLERKSRQSKHRSNDAAQFADKNTKKEQD